MKDIETLLTRARATISNYCQTSCNADCCKIGSLKMSPAEAEIVTAGDTGQTETVGDQVRLQLNPCPRLQNSRCSVYAQRPATCASFPLRTARLGDAKIIVAGRCRAIDAGVVDAHLEELEAMGYEVFRWSDCGDESQKLPCFCDKTDPEEPPQP